MKWLVCNFLLLLSIGSHTSMHNLMLLLKILPSQIVSISGISANANFQSDTNTRYAVVGDVILSADSNFFCDSLIFDSDIDSGVIRAYNNIQVTTIEGIMSS